jgi:2'-hydroxyisoflavone reductase
VRDLSNFVLDQATGAATTPVWLPEEFLFSQGVQPWAELPLWVPGAAGFRAVSGAKAHAAGLRTRPFGDTVHDTWAWLRDGGAVRTAPGTPPFGLAREKEQHVLAAWKAR